MAFVKRSAAYYNGLDKKYDGGSASQSWQPSTSTRMRPWNGIRKRRIFLGILVVGLLYLFFKNMPTDVPPAGNRIDPLTGLNRDRMPKRISPNTQNDKLNTPGNGELYDGPVKFYALANTLRDHVRRRSAGKENVVFVLYNLRSAASLAALACEVALHNRTSVHILLSCLQENPVQEIIELAGLSRQDCPVYWHDARTDHNAQSSPARLAVALQSALGHVHSYLRPAVVVMDRQQSRHPQLMAAIKSRLDQTWTPLVVLPDDALSSMNWITTLDAKGISLLNQNQIDILITPYRSSSGSLMRLLESIQSAQYGKLPLPRITVEIPPDIDPFALRYLENFRWPLEVPTSPSKLVLRKQLKHYSTHPSLSVIHTLESFYPPSYPLSHILLLDPDVELSPDYLNYLHFLTTEYKYSSKGENITNLLMGISLDISTPIPGKSHQDTSFVLSQNPSSTATLYFGDKWIELQNYISLRLQQDPTLSKKISETSDSPSDSSSTSSPSRQAPLHPHISDLMRAQNYYILHPTFSTTPDSRLITIHTESHPSLESFSLSQPDFSTDDLLRIPPPNLDETTTILTSENTLPLPLSTSRHHPRPDLSQGYLSSLLEKSSYASLPPDRDIPLLDHTGHAVNWIESIIAANQYADKVRVEVGGCNKEDEVDRSVKGVDRLFCGKEGDGVGV